MMPPPARASSANPNTPVPTSRRSLASGICGTHDPNTTPCMKKISAMVQRACKGDATNGMGPDSCRLPQELGASRRSDLRRSPSRANHWEGVLHDPALVRIDYDARHGYVTRAGERENGG